MTAAASPVTVQGLPASNVPASTSTAARPDNFWQQPFAGGGAGGGGRGGGLRTSLPSGGGGAGGRGVGGGAGGGVEVVKALFDYVAQVRLFIGLRCEGPCGCFAVPTDVPREV